MAESRRQWSIRIVGIDCVGIPTYDVCNMVGTEGEAMSLVRSLSELARPVAIATQERVLWLREGDMVIAVPEVARG